MKIGLNDKEFSNELDLLIVWMYWIRFVNNKMYLFISFCFEEICYE